MASLDLENYLGLTSDIVFYTVFLASGILILGRHWMKRLTWNQKGLLFIISMLSLRILFFLTANMNELFTGEIYSADVPALLHPYQFPWQAPYGIIWYWLTQAITYLVLPIVRLPLSLFNVSCECMVRLTYLDGHIVSYAYTFNEYMLGISMMIGYTLLSIPFYWYLRKSLLLVPFFITDNFFWATTPVNVPILLFVILGIYNWKLLPLAPLAKLPFGAGIEVWNYALGSASSIGHWFPHVTYGVWWMIAILSWLPWKHSWHFKPDSMQRQILLNTIDLRRLMYE